MMVFHYSNFLLLIADYYTTQSVFELGDMMLQVKLDTQRWGGEHSDGPSTSNVECNTIFLNQVFQDK